VSIRDLTARRLVLVGVGMAALGLAAGAFGGPGHIPVSALVELAGADYWLVAAVAAVGAVVSLGAVVSGRERHLAQSETPEPERPTEVPAPGDRFEQTVGSWWFPLPIVGATAREEVRERLRLVAIETVARTGDMPRSEARAAVTDGTWTDDPAASAYLRGSGDTSVGVSSAWRERRSVRRTAAVIVGIDREDGGGDR